MPKNKILGLSDEIIENRVNFIKKAVDMDIFSIETFACFYDLSIKKMTNFLKHHYPEALEKESYNPISLDKLITQREKILAKAENEEERLKMLRKMGYWCEPIDFWDRYQKPDSPLYMDCLKALLNYSFNKRTNPDIYTKNLDEEDKQYFIDIIKEYDEKAEDIILNEKKEELAYLLKNSQTVQSVVFLTGITDSALADFVHCLEYEYNSNKTDLIGKHTPSKSAYKLVTRREEVWRLYTEFGSSYGRTQQEIADMLGITRATVIHDIKAYKKEHPEVIDVTQLHQPRHIGEKATIQRQKDIEYVIKAYHNKETVYSIAKHLKKSTLYVENIIKENDLKANGSLKTTKKMLKTLITAKKEEGQFTKFNDIYPTNSQWLHGTTSHLLEKDNAPAYTEDANLRNSMRMPHLYNLKKAMNALRLDKDFLKDYKEAISEIQYKEAITKLNTKDENDDIIEVESEI